MEEGKGGKGCAAPCIKSSHFSLFKLAGGEGRGRGEGVRDRACSQPKKEGRRKKKRGKFSVWSRVDP